MVAKVGLYGVGMIVGLTGLAALVVAKVIHDCLERNGWI